MQGRTNPKVQEMVRGGFNTTGFWKGENILAGRARVAREDEGSQDITLDFERGKIVNLTINHNYFLLFSK